MEKSLVSTIQPTQLMEILDFISLDLPHQPGGRLKQPHHRVAPRLCQCPAEILLQVSRCKHVLHFTQTPHHSYSAQSTPARLLPHKTRGSSRCESLFSNTRDSLTRSNYHWSFCFIIPSILQIFPLNHCLDTEQRLCSVQRITMWPIQIKIQSSQTTSWNRI